MINNDVLRRTRFALDLPDHQLKTLIEDGLNSAADSSSVAPTITEDQLAGWLCRENDALFVECPDAILHAFLDGLIRFKRGPSDDKNVATAGVDNQSGPAANRAAEGVPGHNNAILKKLRIALALRSDDVLADIQRAGLKLTASELSAFFRKPNHRKYKLCGDQVLRRFLQGLVMRLRPDKAASGSPSTSGADSRAGSPAESESVNSHIWGRKPSSPDSKRPTTKPSHKPRPQVAATPATDEGRSPADTDNNSDSRNVLKLADGVHAKPRRRRKR